MFRRRTPLFCESIFSTYAMIALIAYLQMTELELNTFFSQFGTVKDSKIITDRNGVSKG